MWAGGILRIHSGKAISAKQVTLRFGNTQVDQEAACTWGLYQRFGILCRHSTAAVRCECATALKTLVWSSCFSLRSTPCLLIMVVSKMILPSRLHLNLISYPSFRTRPRFSQHYRGAKIQQGIRLHQQRFRLGHYRSAAASPRFKIAPPVLSDLSRNFTHHACCIASSPSFSSYMFITHPLLLRQSFLHEPLPHTLLHSSIMSRSAALYYWHLQL